MAEKRRIEVRDQDHNDELGRDGLHSRDLEKSWKEWLIEDLARYWFVTLTLAIDILFGLWLNYAFSGAGVIGPVVFLAIAVPIEIFLYLFLWGKKGILISRN